MRPLHSAQQHKSLWQKKIVAGFTLVELIVVITILVILGTIAFISLSGFSGSARDSSRVSDLSLISKSLDIHYTKLWSFPSPTSATGITFGSSSSVVWYQWTVWEGVISSLGWVWARISTKPTDPLSKSEYRYSLPTGVNEYLLGADYEGDSVAWRASWELSPAMAGENWEDSVIARLARSNPGKNDRGSDHTKKDDLSWIASLRSQWLMHSFLSTNAESRGIFGLDLASASTGSPTISYLKGTYNGVATRVSSGSTINIIALPSIFLASGSTGTIVDASSRNFLLQGKSLSGVSFAPKVVYSSGALPANDTERLLFSSGIIAAYSGTSLATNSDVASFIANVSNTGSLAAVGGNFVRNKFGGNGPSIVATASSSSSSSYSVGNSLMFNGSSQYLNRTFTGAGNQTKWTYSLWIKPWFGTALNGGIFPLLIWWDGTSTDYAEINLHTDPASGQFGHIAWYRDGAPWRTSYLGRETIAKFRDPTSWYHFVFVYDSNNSEPADQVIIYANGLRVSSFSDTTGPSPGYATPINGVGTFRIGKSTNAYYGAWYLADINFVDSGALLPTSFGKTDANGQWVPQPYTGDYGANGFHLDFSSGATTTTLGKDSAPIAGTHLTARDWALNGYADTSSQVIDTPTNNFATLNPLSHQDGATLVWSNGNLTMRPTTSSPTTNRNVGTMGIVTPTYFEVKIDSSFAIAGNYIFAGIKTTTDVFETVNLGSYPAGATEWLMSDYNGQATHSGGIVATGLGSFSPGDYFRVAVNPITGKVWFGKNSSWSGDPSAGTGETYSGIPANTLPLVYCYNSVSTQQITTNFWQWWQSWLQYYSDAGGYFKYAPPTGFKALSTTNLPSVTTVTSGSFTGNTNTDGPFVFTNGAPTSLTINGNPVTFGTHADRTAGGFKLKSALGTYNSTGTNTWTGIVTTPFKYANGQVNP